MSDSGTTVPNTFTTSYSGPKGTTQRNRKSMAPRTKQSAKPRSKGSPGFRGWNSR